MHLAIDIFYIFNIAKMANKHKFLVLAQSVVLDSTVKQAKAANLTEDSVTTDFVHFGVPWFVFR